MMTRIRLTLILLFAAWLPTFGQSGEVRKVAILETVDKEKKISYGVKLMVRSNLALAITNTPGYEGYDRVDIASIMGEQEFQRTGMVNDDQIRRLGEMTGATDVLIAEAAKIDDNNIIITAKILDVESAKLLRTSYEQSETNPQALEVACRNVAARLLDVELNGTAVKTKKVNTVSSPATTSYSNNSNTQINTEEVNTPVFVERAAKKHFGPRYNGWADFGLSFGFDTLTIGVTTTHGCLINPYVFAGAGIGFVCDVFYSDIGFPIYADVRGIYPVNDNFRLFADFKIGAMPVVDYGAGVYTSLTAGIAYKRIEASIGYVQVVYMPTFGLNLGVRFGSVN